MIAKNLPVMDLVKFRRLSERRRSTFAKNLKLPRRPKSPDSGGGNYWTRCVSGITNAFRANNSQFIQEKIEDVSSVYDSTKLKRVKTMYKRNLEILHNYLNFDFSAWRPLKEVTFHPCPRLTLVIEDIPVQVCPNLIFSYEENEEQQIGAVWFICWQEGFLQGDYGIFSEALFRYLTFVTSGKFNINPNDCSIIDVSTMNCFRYRQVLEGSVTPLLDNTVSTLKRYL